jgi:MFS transporter, ACS family, solute carrier family 17 (sodium-dependent inorganic phosphate cotransporter), member 5
LGYMIHYANKMKMSVAIVCMVNHTAIRELSSNANNLSKLSQCTSSNSSESGDDGSFNWNKLIQGFILSSFFYGYAISQLPAGWLSLKYGGKMIYLIGMFIASVISFITPVLTEVHFGLLIACRALTGFALGLSWPCMYSMWSSWAPPKERGKLIGISNSGTQVGSIIMLPLGGFLCTYGFAGGWPSIFYITGILGIVWCVLWFFCTADAPEQHKFISKEELDYLALETKNIAHHITHHSKVPWKEVFKSKPVWALIVGHTTSNFGVYLFLSNLNSFPYSITKLIVYFIYKQIFQHI